MLLTLAALAIGATMVSSFAAGYAYRIRSEYKHWVDISHDIDARLLEAGQLLLEAQGLRDKLAAALAEMTAPSGQEQKEQ